MPVEMEVNRGSGTSDQNIDHKPTHSISESIQPTNKDAIRSALAGRASEVAVVETKISSKLEIKGLAPEFFAHISQDTNFQQLTPQQQKKLMEVAHSVLGLSPATSEVNSLVADMKLLLARKVNGNAALISVDRSTSGQTLLDNLHMLATHEPALLSSGLKDKKQDLVRSLIQECGAPRVKVNQGEYASCVTTVANGKLAANQPAEYVRIVQELATRGRADLYQGVGRTGPTSMQLEYSSSAATADSLKGRSISESLFQNSFEKMVGGYKNGLYNHQAESVYEAVFGTGFTRLDSSQEALSALKAGISKSEANMVSLKWATNGAHSNHALEVLDIVSKKNIEKIDGKEVVVIGKGDDQITIALTPELRKALEQGEVVFNRNPWGSTYPCPEGIGAYIADKERAIVWMTADNFSERLNYALVQGGDFGVTAGSDLDKPSDVQTIFLTDEEILESSSVSEKSTNRRKGEITDEKIATKRFGPSTHIFDNGKRTEDEPRATRSKRSAAGDVVYVPKGFQIKDIPQSYGGAPYNFGGSPGEQQLISDLSLHGAADTNRLINTFLKTGGEMKEDFWAVHAKTPALRHQTIEEMAVVVKATLQNPHINDDEKMQILQPYIELDPRRVVQALKPLEESGYTDVRKDFVALYKGKLPAELQRYLDESLKELSRDKQAEQFGPEAKKVAEDLLAGLNSSSSKSTLFNSKFCGLLYPPPPARQYSEEQITAIKNAFISLDPKGRTLEEAVSGFFGNDTYTCGAIVAWLRGERDTMDANVLAYSMKGAGTYRKILFDVLEARRNSAEEGTSLGDIDKEFRKVTKGESFSDWVWGEWDLSKTDAVRAVEMFKGNYQTADIHYLKNELKNTEAWEYVLGRRSRAEINAFMKEYQVLEKTSLLDKYPYRENEGDVGSYNRAYNFRIMALVRGKEAVVERAASAWRLRALQRNITEDDRNNWNKLPEEYKTKFEEFYSGKFGSKFSDDLNNSHYSYQTRIAEEAASHDAEQDREAQKYRQPWEQAPTRTAYSALPAPSAPSFGYAIN